MKENRNIIYLNSVSYIYMNIYIFHIYEIFHIYIYIYVGCGIGVPHGKHPPLSPNLNRNAWFWGMYLWIFWTWKVQCKANAHPSNLEYYTSEIAWNLSVIDEYCWKTQGVWLQTSTWFANATHVCWVSEMYSFAAGPYCFSSATCWWQKYLKLWLFF